MSHTNLTATRYPHAHSSTDQFDHLQTNRDAPAEPTHLQPTDDLFEVLSGIPPVDFAANLYAALVAGRHMTSILREVVSLRLGTGKLTPNEYFYYRLWESALSREERTRFVGKQAQQPMHIACNNTCWYAAASDKLMFQTLLAGTGLPAPELLAITGRNRLAPQGRLLGNQAAIASFLREPRDCLEIGGVDAWLGFQGW